MSTPGRLTRVLQSQVFEFNTPSDEWVIEHGFNELDVLVDVMIDFGGSLQKIIPLDIVNTDENNITVTFTLPQTGRVTVLARARVRTNEPTVTPDPPEPDPDPVTVTELSSISTPYVAGRQYLIITHQDTGLAAGIPSTAGGFISWTNTTSHQTSPGGYKRYWIGTATGTGTGTTTATGTNGGVFTGIVYEFSNANSISARATRTTAGSSATNRVPTTNFMLFGLGITVKTGATPKCEMTLTGLGTALATNYGGVSVQQNKFASYSYTDPSTVSMSVTNTPTGISFVLFEIGTV